MHIQHFGTLTAFQGTGDEGNRDVTERLHRFSEMANMTTTAQASSPCQTVQTLQTFTGSRDQEGKKEGMEEENEEGRKGGRKEGRKDKGVTEEMTRSC